MDFEGVVKDEAKIFFENGDWEHFQDGPTRLKKDLDLELYNHNDSVAKLVFIYEILRLLKIDLEVHAKWCNASSPERCWEHKYYFKCVYYLEQLIGELNPEYDFTILRPQINADLVHENLNQLAAYPEAGKLYEAALNKLNEQSFNRNLLDDLRLSLEIILKEVLGNDKSLENQQKDLGDFLKRKDVSKECRNMFNTLLNYYCIYQNTYVKHNDGVKKNEIDFILNLTSSVINFIIKQ